MPTHGQAGKEKREAGRGGKQAWMRLQLVKSDVDWWSRSVDDGVIEPSARTWGRLSISGAQKGEGKPGYEHQQQQQPGTEFFGRGCNRRGGETRVVCDVTRTVLCVPCRSGAWKLFCVFFRSLYLSLPPTQAYQPRTNLNGPTGPLPRVCGLRQAIACPDRRLRRRHSLRHPRRCSRHRPARIHTKDSLEIS